MSEKNVCLCLKFVSVFSTVPWIFSIYNTWRHCIQSEAGTQPAWLFCFPVIVLQTTRGRLPEYGRQLIVTIIIGIVIFV